MTSTPPRRSRWTRIALLLAALALVGGAAGAGAVYALFLRDLPDPYSVADYRPALATTVLDREGRPIGEFYRERRRLVPFEQVPPHVVDAFVSAEDASFFEHEGIDFRSIVRAAWKNLLAGDKVEGASTITQQMVKGLLLTPERTYRRKIREMILARRIEQRFTKQEILFLYLNQIYFGHGAYGIAEAARTYFDETVEELDVSEAALLAGLPKAPSRYSPFGAPEKAERRRRYVLERMRETGAIDAAAYESAVAARPRFRDGSKPEAFEAAAYFAEDVRRYLFDALGGDVVLEGGLRVETTLDLDLQRLAVTALRQGLEELDRRNGYRGPLRRVEKGALEAEIARLGEENGLLDPDPEADADAADDDDAGLAPAEPEDRELSTDADAAPADDGDPTLLGVVTAVHEGDERAEVAFGGGLRGTVALADVSWARPADPDRRPYAETRIGKIFRVGDVARFEPRPPAEGESAPDGKQQPLRLLLRQEPQVQGALLSLDVASGDVLALVGGYDFAQSQFDRATQARRQPGSAFKPLVYGAALAQRADDGRPLYTPASIVHDRPKVYTDRYTGLVWKPQNYGREFYGPITLRTALAKSVNNAAVHLCEQVGVGQVIAYARRLGIRSPLEPSLSLALGTSDLTLLELTRAYAVFPRGGRRVVPAFVRRVTDAEGNVLLENVALDEPTAPAEAAPVAEPSDVASDDALGAPEPEAADGDQLIPPEQAFLMADMLRAVVLEGTGRRAASLGRPLAGKTGTTNDQADAWFVGFSPELATGVWVGFDESRYLGSGETGSRAALPIWKDYMGAALEGRPKRDFTAPAHSAIVWARIDRETGLLASHQSRHTVFQPFVAGSEPTRSAAAAQRDDRALRNLREDSFVEMRAFEPGAH